MQSDRFLDATVSPKFNWGAAMEKVAGKVKEVKSKGTSKVKATLSSPVKSMKLRAKVSNNGNEPEENKDKSRKFDLNQGLKTVGDTLVGIFRKPDNITNTTVIQSPKDNEDDNTMLYVGIGGGVLLLVVLLIVFMK